MGGYTVSNRQSSGEDGCGALFGGGQPQEGEAFFFLVLVGAFGSQGLGLTAHGSRPRALSLGSGVPREPPKVSRPLTSDGIPPPTSPVMTTVQPATGPPLIATPRLRLDPFTVDDAAFIVALLTDPDWLRYIGDRGVRTEEEARGYLAAGPLASYATHGFGLYRVARRDTGAPIGMCGLLRRDTLPDVDLGFAFLPAHRGQGFAREAAAATLAYARETLGLDRIVAIVSPANASSIRVLEALGMGRTGAVQLTTGADVLLLYRVTSS